MTFAVSFQVRGSDLDSSGFFSVRSAFSYYNEVAMRHDSEQGYSWEKNREMGFSWILYRWRSRFFRSSREGEWLTMRTWISKIDRFMIYREFEVLDAEQELVSQAVCICAAMDVETRMLIRIPKKLTEDYPIIDRTNFSSYEQYKNLEIIDGKKKLFEIRYCDIDMNCHVNNLVYIDWVMDALPTELRSSVRELDLIYRNEIRGESHVLICMSQNKSDGNEIEGKILCKDGSKEFSVFVLKLIK